jgi:hypothetical protein
MNTRSDMNTPALSPLNQPRRREARPHPADRGRSRGLRLVAALRDDAGAATAEYAMVVLAAVGLGGLLAVILKSGEVRSMLTELISRALTAA